MRENQTFTAVIKNAGEWWIGWIEEAPVVNCQERSRDELLSTLRVTWVEALEMERAKARANLEAHAVRFSEASTILEDEFALTRKDPDAEGNSGSCHWGRVVSETCSWSSIPTGNRTAFA